MATVDSDYLFKLAQDKSAASRSELVRTISDLFFNTAEELTDRERSLMFNILHSVIFDVELSVRRNLCEKLADLADVPAELVKTLSMDDVEVAFPILTRSKVLSDTDLIEVIRHRTLEHQLAITIREGISEDVSDALVETNHVGVIESLLKNQSAAISADTMAYLVEQSQRFDAFQEPLLRRDDLEGDLAQRMYLWVSAALRQHIIENFDIAPEDVDSLIEEAAFQELEASNISREESSKSETLSVDLDNGGMIKPDILVAALRDGEVSLFVSLFGRATGLRETLIMRILFEPGGEGLAIACRAIGMDKTDFVSIFTLSRKARPKAMRNFNRELSAIQRLYDQMTQDAAKKVVVKWSRTSVYLSAIRELELSAAEDD